MRYFERHAPPDFLVENAKKWNNQWVLAKNKNAGAAFNWYKFQKTPINQLIYPLLEAQNEGHCAYCDAFPPKISDKTIDHFKPKSNPDFYQFAYDWTNLYHACNDCQRAKMEQFSENLLQPDDENFRFERFFIYNFTNHQIEVNPIAADHDQIKANKTLEILQFNENGQVVSRRHAWERWQGLSENNRFLIDFPFRFIFF
jgi:uncharacterized protein (TIGR02646 family)